MAALAAALGLTACGPGAPAPSTDAMYRRVDAAGASLDAGMARAMISAYRGNRGLGALALDAGLSAQAQAQAAQMAAADRPGTAEGVKAELVRQGLRGPVGANVSAGYRTLAEAFSGWRDSPQHNQVMLMQGASRMGIAAARAPQSKYGVYWVLIVAGP
jgi:uncharacterized protein YkwD